MHAGMAMLNGHRWACLFCKLLDLFDQGHCAQSLKDDD